LKERARRLVQAESQEDAQAVEKQREGRNMERTKVCDPLQNEDCSRTTNENRQQKTRLQNDLPLPYENSQEPEQLQPRAPAGLTQADGTTTEFAGRSLSNRRSDFELVSESGKQDSISMAGSSLSEMQALTNQSLPNGSVFSGQNDRTDRNNAADLAMPQHEIMQPLRQRSVWGKEDDLTAVKMVHRPNPYANVPALYDMYVQASSNQRPLERFGLDVFRNSVADPHAIPMDLPQGPDYVLGPGDGIEIDLWGGVSQRLMRVVDRQGRVSLPEVGPLLVSGRSLDEVQRAVQQVLRTEYRDISADVTLSRLRTVRVYVVGDVAQPGAYDISSLSTPLNALFAAGGVTSRGTLRAVKHFRGKQLIEEVDTYDLLLHGVRSGMQRLENGDTLLVSPMGSQVTVDGMVRRPAVYELHGETSLSEILELAGGILSTATLRHVEVQRVETHEKRTMLSLDLTAASADDAAQKQLDVFKIADGDAVHIFPIAAYNESAVYLEGQVLRPGKYSHKDGMKLGDLIASYKDLMPEPAPHYAEIVRLNPPDFRPTVESFDLAAAMANPELAPKLQALDTVRIFSRYDFEPPPAVWVGGEVRGPGKYRTSGQAHLRDAIQLAGGISADASLDSAQLFRTQADGTMRILNVNLREALAGNPSDNLLLQSRDRILIQKNPAKVDPPTVYIKGEVAKPGRYPLTSNMQPQDLIRVAGGLKRTADSASADLTHYAAGDTPQAATHGEVNLSAALAGESKADLLLNDGDVLTIRRNPGRSDIGAMVTLKGEVQHPGTYGIRPGERLSSVLARAGGFGSEAYPYGAILMRREVRELEMKSQSQLVLRVKTEEENLRSLPEADNDQKNAKLNAIAQTETALVQLQANPPVGRVVVHIQPDIKQWKNTAADVAIRDGDVLLVPKKAGYVMVNGQVFNPTAISYQGSRTVKWYLSQAGGFTQLADRKAVFVIRADGSVLAAKNNGDAWWAGNPLNNTLRPGDTVIVPEKAPKIGTRNWATLLQAAQVASSVALSVAYIHP
jgi:protein involved in polysaccharide export with SLBB domain